MPVYEYACTECGERLEVRQSFSDEPLTACPSCSGRLRKVLSPVGVVFKGSGFYRTDSRSNATASAGSRSASSDSSGSSSDTSSSSSSSESSSSGTSTSSSGGGSAGAKAAS